MTLILIFVITINALLILVMLKVSELLGRFSALQNNVGVIATKVDAILAGQADPVVPADAEAALIAVEGAVAALDAKLPAPTPPVV